ncbi:glycosyltransferase family 4 protein, partial [bacterium]|nr:glycosyltransferase family 4 protein [bacterium]
GAGPAEAQLREIAAGDPRIEFMGLVDEDKLRDLYARSIAHVFPPINEDFGLITIESFAAAKPVITTIDSGEPAEIVKQDVTGFIEEPTPDALARRFEWCAKNKQKLEDMGAACLASAAEVTWDRLVDALLGAAEKTRSLNRPVAPSSSQHSGLSTKINLLVTDNQMIDPPVGGGRLRMYELYRHLPADFTTTYLGAHDYPGPEFRDQWLAPNFREIVMPLTAMHFKLHEMWRRLTCGDATVDVTIPLLLGIASPRYRELAAELAPAADILICSHPWVMPFLPARDGMPRVYDSHNCEAAVKGPMLRRTLAGRYLAHVVEKTERLAVTATDLTLACSAEDAGQFGTRYGLGNGRAIVIPNGVDCKRIRPGNAEDKASLKIELNLPERPLAVFVASQYGPNNEAADLLIDVLAERFPGLTIGIVGGVGPAWQERHPGRKPPGNVHIFGFVDHEALPAIYAAADIGVNPMRHGSGTNIKMLDYMAAGLAIVTTPTGARGINGRDREHWALADDDCFELALEELIASPERRAELGKNARNLAETEYDWPIISGKLAEALRKLVRKTCD